MVLSDQSLTALISGEMPMITSSTNLIPLIQPASLDVPIGEKCYCVSVSVSPSETRPLSSLLERFSLYDFVVRPEGTLLQKGLTYLIPLDMGLLLSSGFRATFSPKSTTGRNDAFVRVLTESGEEFDQTSFGYNGKLYLEVTPLSFHMEIYPSGVLTQMRVEDSENGCLSTSELRLLHSKYGIVRDANGKPIDAVIENGALYLHLNLSLGEVPVGYRAIFSPESKAHLGMKGVDKKDEFWETLKLSAHGDLILPANSFSLLHTKERILIPPEVAATMQEYSVGIGEFRIHYAGFFDPGFGGTEGTHGVLEVRPHTLSVCLRDGQLVCKMPFYPVDKIPSSLYSANGNYVNRGPSLPKNIIGSW